MSVRKKYRHLVPSYAQGGAVHAVKVAPDDASAANAASLQAHERHEVREQIDRAVEPPKRQAVVDGMNERRSERMRVWREQGMTPEMEDFFTQRPLFIDRQDLTAKAMNDLYAEGINPDRPGYYDKLAERFHYHLDDRPRAAAQEAVDRTLARAKASVDDDVGTYGGNNSRIVVSEPSPRAIYSGAPTRSVPTGDYNAASGSGRITLSREQKEAARIAGCSEETYARNLLRLHQEKSIGNYGGQS